MSESAWKFGPYRKGMGQATDDRRIRFATQAIKNELVNTHSYTGVNLATPYFGEGTKRAVLKFQGDAGLPLDGKVGPTTSNALFAKRTESIPWGWLRALMHWESLDDPGAEYANADGTFDRGLVMLNSTRKPATESEAFDPAYSLNYAEDYLRSRFNGFVASGCTEGAASPWRLAVGAWRTPQGANDWCAQGAVEPSNADGATWAERAAFYVFRVDTFGRNGWAG